MSSPIALSALEALDIARGTTVNHSAVSQLVKGGSDQ
jgi:hypothetical protein